MQLPINTNLRNLKAYTPPLEGRSDFNGLLLDFNEALIPISVKVQKALLDFTKQNKFRIYPEYGDLKSKIAKYVGCKQNMVFPTNGSYEAIELIFKTFTQNRDEVIIPSPSFAMFAQCAKVNGNKLVSISYGEKGEFPFEEVLRSINSKTKLVIICNPNNPTGGLLPLASIEKITRKAKRNNAMVMVDEAYFEYSQLSALPLLQKFPNLIITRTFSKAFGLAGLRIGYLIASPIIIAEIQKIGSPYSVNCFASSAAKTALSDIASMRKYRAEVMQKAKPLVEKFLQAEGIEFLPSSANFILLKLSNSQKILKELQKQGFLLRPREWKKEIYLRITIGTIAQMRSFLKTFKTLI
ncbi:MAG: histidinol-phosphate transaminase [Candidatus Gracilibacteria bacterium]|nr:histidinol-phosphate transaminase [Candidatus Gracilibacteria bacterium]